MLQVRSIASEAFRYYTQPEYWYDAEEPDIVCD